MLQALCYSCIAVQFKKKNAEKMTANITPSATLLILIIIWSTDMPRMAFLTGYKS